MAMKKYLKISPISTEVIRKKDIDVNVFKQEIEGEERYGFQIYKSNGKIELDLRSPPIYQLANQARKKGKNIVKTLRGLEERTLRVAQTQNPFINFKL